ncbi:MAG: 3'(2'),5'-bisphosphate nucleotidase [Phycisphaera sp.]|nr:3'(2'),5'-bisphosphate nucleotidase [Phycisphaera sp.]
MQDDGLDLLFMLRAVRAAMRATRHVQARRGAAGPQAGAAIEKDDRSPVTVADWASQAVVALELGRLAATAPALAGLPLVGEEEAARLRAPESVPLLAEVVEAVALGVGHRVTREECLTAIDRGRGAPTKDAFFTLDPVDGTKGFLRGEQYAISLALIEQGSVRYGVVGCPNLPASGDRFDRADPVGCVAFAVKDGGAWIERDHGEPTPLRIADWRAGQPIRACESVESAHSRQDLSAQLLASLGAAGRPARLDSQCKYVVVARGGADLYLRLPTRPDYREKIWDHAAGALVASEAGAKVVDTEGFPLDFGRGRELSANKGVVAGHPLLVERAVARLAAMRGNGRP